MSNKVGPLGMFTTKHCKICDKTIVTLNPKGWSYKLLNSNSHSYEWYCSYTCYRKAVKKYESTRKYKSKRKKDL